MQNYFELRTPFLTKILIKKGNTFLVLKNAESDQSNPRSGWESVGGHVESGEDLETSLQREIREEVGDIEVEVLCPFHAFLFYPGTNKSLGGIVYVGEYISGEIRLDGKEHSEYKWMTIEEIRTMDESRGLQMELDAYEKFINQIPKIV